MSEWRIEYDNDTGSGDEGFHEWWTVTDGSRRFQCDTESDANFLFDRLSEWSPIETAPKDGTVFLAWGKYEPHPATVKWISGIITYVCDDALVLESESDVDCSYKEPTTLTHWMPLPAPPVTD